MFEFSSRQPRAVHPIVSRSACCLLFFVACILASPCLAAEPVSFDTLQNQYKNDEQPLLKRFCLNCHSTDESAGEFDLERFTTLADVRKAPRVWQKVAEMLDNGEMPPRKAKQPSVDERKQLRGWIERYLNAEAHAGAGDPGPVVLRRLNNAEYTYTIRDLTGVNLNPAREFPADGAAGEGFTNAGNALGMSPALITKYLDAGKEIARHAVLLPDGLRFSAGVTRRDFTDEIIGEIKRFYTQFADGDGRIPLDRYLAATMEEREALAAGSKTAAQVAAARGLNAKYMSALWNVLTSREASPLLGPVRTRWQAAKPQDAPALAADIIRWQQALSRFQSVGHIKPWVVVVNPLTARHEFRFKIPEPATGGEVTLYLTAGDAGDGNENDFVVWQRPRLVTPGRPDLLLRDVRGFTRELVARREKVFASAAKCLAAAAEAGAAKDKLDPADLAHRHGVDDASLAAWLDYLGIGPTAAIRLDHFTNQMRKGGGYEFVNGWGADATPLLLASSGDKHVRIPGNMKPHGVVVHPSPTLQAAAGWRSPIAGAVRVSAKVTHAHPECGNGVTWSLELRRGATRQRLATGVAQGAKTVDVGPIEHVAVQAGDLVSLLIGPRDGNHSCDLTDLEFVIKAGDDREWSLTRDVSDDVLAGNPHSDRMGNKEVWHFYTEPVKAGETGPIIPAGSLLARWQSAERADEKQKLADEVQKLLVGGPPATKDHPDAVLYRQLASLGGPLFAGARPAAGSAAASPGTESAPSQWGLDPAAFGKHPTGGEVDAASLCLRAPATVAIRLPADLVAGCELVTAGTLHEPTGHEGSVQLLVGIAQIDPLTVLRSDAPVLAAEGSSARTRITQAFDEFRKWFPAAVCYTRVVPVDEVVTLALFHREDEPLQRLMLDDDQRARIDRLWTELKYVSHEPLGLVDSFNQLMEYATQDSDPKLFEHHRKPINDGAAKFRQLLIDNEPKQLAALVDFAADVFRRPLAETEKQELRDLYASLRKQDLPHDAALRLTLARMFVAPVFLYRLEQAPSGASAGPVSSGELANRLSYFLWSSLPDRELRDTAAAGKLVDPDVLVAQARRMLKDARTRRLATEFGCQMLHIYDFHLLDEKSERHFPSFSALRGDMYEESIRFMADVFQRDAPILELWDSDHTFLNESLAKHYGIPDVTGPEWRRVDGIRQYGRGGILGQATTLAKQSGASRTSPILRGNWVSEVLLGERLPRPPKDVPRLPDDEAATEGLTVRQLVEKHSSDPRCATCHVRIDPIGFALEGYDAIGRRRDKDLADRPIQTRSRTQDGAEIAGLEGLRKYLLTTRHDAVLRQFCKKLLGFALGRGAQLSDEPLLQEMQQNLKRHDYRFFAAVEPILRSRQFREIRGRDAPAEAAN